MIFINRKLVSEMEKSEIILLSDTGVAEDALNHALLESLNDKGVLRKVLLVPPDMTRMHSGAGQITASYYHILQSYCQVDIMPALGTHAPMTVKEIREFFGPDIPLERFLYHDWRNDVVSIGEVPGSVMSMFSEGLIDNPVEISINYHLLDPSYDLIISIGQVVPHEVVGMANYSKNILVGCGGTDVINQSHILGAVYGMERIMGRDHSPVRKLFDYAEINFLQRLKIMYVLTVTTQKNNQVNIHGLFIGRNRMLFEKAVRLSQQVNLNVVATPLKKVVVYLDEREFKSTWLGNKAIYRTRMAIADDGELLVLAPGVCKFGEDEGNDQLIRKYGYIGRQKVLGLYTVQDDLKNNLSVAAHLIHGSSDGRFKITYAVAQLSKQEVEAVGFGYMDLASAYERYNPSEMVEGFNTLPDGEEIFYISNPALGLWSVEVDSNSD